MSDLIEKLRPVERELAKEYEEFVLFALLHIDGDPYENWDLVVASRRMDRKDYDRHLESILEVLRKHLRFKDFLRVVGVVILPADHPDVQDAACRYAVEDSVREICHRELFKKHINEGYIMTARPRVLDMPVAITEDAVGRAPSSAAA